MAAHPRGAFVAKKVGYDSYDHHHWKGASTIWGSNGTIVGANIIRDIC
jgi:hypothetical protein